MGMRRRIYFCSALLILSGVLAMRWNVVIGGQLFSKSLRGFTTFKMELQGQEGWLVAGALMLLPYVLLMVFIPLFLRDSPTAKLHADTVTVSDGEPAKQG
jgi:predicted membrane protein